MFILKEPNSPLKSEEHFTGFEVNDDLLDIIVNKKKCKYFFIIIIYKLNIIYVDNIIYCYFTMFSFTI